MTPDLVIFDCDGVIMDSEGPTLRMLRDDLAARGLDLPLDRAMDLFIGSTMSGVAAKARDHGAALPDDWVEGFYDRLYVRLKRGTPLIDGIESVLDRLDAAAIPYCVGSNGRHAKMAITIGQHKALWDRLSGRLYAAEDVPAPKPAPDLFLHAAHEFAVPPARCIVVEDSPTGALAAQRAGMTCMGYAPHDSGAGLAAHGATVFSAMAALPALLGL
ncbi:HAD family phosphatase [Roseinatronobacter sp. S2]|uniref:HAD family hydrolase n=1 Tax=Roseinatronobacter sp. S2 TaxID=3035471 RepID=UPI00240F637F|nr:HAD family phosphatase [Roseinatronobacter sp. S2]WFE75296.1 HAD family phosphatase [Roseinatronobacter sp. S2]